MKKKVSAADILAEMAKTYKQRNGQYKDNYVVVGQLMAVLFPTGVVLRTPSDFERWHLFELLVVKLTRYTQVGLTHRDSIHDLAVYSAMLEMLIANGQTQEVKSV